MITTLQTLITHRTLTDDRAALRSSLAWIREQVADLPVHITDYEKNGQPSLLITTRKTATPKLWLAAHLDVVPASPELFVPRIENDALIGRGSFDMKFAIASYLHILRDLAANLADYDFGLMITTDEEVGGFNGTKALLDEGFLSEVCFLPDGGQPWKLELGAKGRLHVRVESTGQSAHGSRPWLGLNAISELIHFLNLAEREFPPHGPDDFLPTLNIGAISGGGTTNQVADRAEAHLDIRFPREEDRARIKGALHALAAQCPGIRLHHESEASSFVAAESDHLERFRAIAATLHGIDCEGIFSHGASDARFFGEKNIPTVVIQPEGGGHHGEQEWLSLSEFTKFHEITREFVIATAGKPHLGGKK